MTENEFKIIFNRYHKELIFYAEGLVGEMEEDFVSIAFVKLWQVENHIDPKGFLIITIRNECLNHIKKENNLKTRERIAVDLYTNEYVEAKEIQSELIARIVNEIESLPAGQKKIAKLLTMEYTQVEIAEILNLHPTTIAVQVMKIRKKLKPLNNYMK